MVAFVQPQSPQALYEQALRQRLEALLPESAFWLQALRRDAWARFEMLGFPTRHLEAWKYINLRPLLGEAFQPHVRTGALTFSDLPADCLTSTGDGVVRLVFVNGRLDGALSSLPEVPEGAYVGSLRAALDDPRYTDDIQTALNASLEAENDAFSALNTALFEDGAFIYLPSGLALMPFVQIVWMTTASREPRAAYPRNLFLLGENSRLNLSIHYVGEGEGLYFNASAQSFRLAAGAQAECAVIFQEGTNAWHLASNRNYLAENSRLDFSTVTLGGQVTRQSIHTLLEGERAAVYLHGLDVLVGSTEVYHHTVTEHWVPDGVSEQYYKGILDDESRSEFNGMVFVAKGAHGTDSRQLNKSLLLSENARVWTRPQLQINADDVKCAHGATVGQLEKDQLFYLASRGLDRELAQGLLTFGFAEEMIEKLSYAPLREILNRQVLLNLHHTEASVKQKLGA